MRGDLEALRPRVFGVSLTPGSGPLRGGEHTLEALRMREAIARQIYRVWHKLARASRPARRCCHASPGFGRRGFGDARRDEALRFGYYAPSLPRRAAYHRKMALAKEKPPVWRNPTCRLLPFSTASVAATTAAIMSRAVVCLQHSIYSREVTLSLVWHA